MEVKLGFIKYLTLKVKWTLHSIFTIEEYHWWVRIVEKREQKLRKIS